jgi:hypothetical protein
MFLLDDDNKAKDAGEEAADDFMKGFEKGAKKDE